MRELVVSFAMKAFAKAPLRKFHRQFLERKFETEARKNQGLTNSFGDNWGEQLEDLKGYGSLRRYQHGSQ